MKPRTPSVFPFATLIAVRRRRVENAIAEVKRRQAQRDTVVAQCAALTARIDGIQQQRAVLQCKVGAYFSALSIVDLTLHHERIAFLDEQREALRQQWFEAELALRERERTLTQAKQACRRAQARLDAIEAQHAHWLRTVRLRTARREDDVAGELGNACAIVRGVCA